MSVINFPELKAQRFVRSDRRPIFRRGGFFPYSFFPSQFRFCRRSFGVPALARHERKPVLKFQCRLTHTALFHGGHKIQHVAFGAAASGKTLEAVFYDAHPERFYVGAFVNWTATVQLAPLPTE